jgi:hypothetical protein
MTLSLLKSTMPSYKVIICPAHNSDWSSGPHVRLIDQRNSSEIGFTSVSLTITRRDAWAMVVREGSRLRVPIEFCNVTPIFETRRA